MENKYALMPDAMPALKPCSCSCSALLLLLLDGVGGVLTLLQKKAVTISSLRKFPPFFQKFHPTQRTFNTPLTYI